MSSDSELKEKQKRFCEEFVVDLNGTQAAIRAGYTENEPAAAVQAARLLKNAKVQSLIRELISTKAQRTRITQDEVFNEMARIAMADIGKAFDEKGCLIKDIHSIPEEVRRCISSIEVEQLYEGEGRDKYEIGNIVKIKFWSKDKQLENLGRHFQMFVERVKHEGTITIADLVAEAAAPPKDHE